MCNRRALLVYPANTMTKLSPAAYEVWYAAWDCPIGDCESVEYARRRQIAAALRAAAFHLHSEEYETCGGASYALMIEVDDLLAIANELEACSHGARQ